ncbi:hypothetical protein M3Y98_00947700 [Aphelenchoides besseyi]|nr:hypothetical protein M3Y98_00947700 [Aphelenchoides besseyi]
MFACSRNILILICGNCTVNAVQKNFGEHMGITRKQLLMTRSCTELNFDKIHSLSSTRNLELKYWAIIDQLEFFGQVYRLYQRCRDEFIQLDDNGTRPAVRCTVTVNAIIHEYRIKCNHDAGGTNSAMRFKPNMIELYCYKVLEAIGVGAKVTFFRNLVESRLIIYIASRLLPNFTEMGKILHSDFDPEQVRRSLVQIHFLSSFLSLGDMSNANIGLNTDGSPVIVDFMMSNYDPIEKFLNNTDTLQGEECKKILEDCNVSKRLEIAKESIVKWSFVQKLDEAEKKLDEEKEIFGRAESDFEKKTEDVKIFIDRVKSNVKDLLNRDTDTSFSLLNLHADLDPNHKWFYI